MAMQSGHYNRIFVKNLKQDQEDEFTSFCFENGAQGVFQDLQFTQADLVYYPEISNLEHINVNVIFDQSPPLDFFSQLTAHYPGATAENFTEPNKDWLEEWKKGFEPFLFVEPFWIVPSWRQAPPEAKQIIVMEPGMAFGTGTHETTKLAAQLVSKAMFEGATVIDVGTGTGILAIIADRLHASKVEAVDIDREALRVARENCDINKAQKIFISEKDISQIEEKFDIVIANIIDGALLEIKKDLFKSMNGKLILSGVLREREERFLYEFLKGQNFKVKERIEDGEWAAYLIE